MKIVGFGDSFITPAIQNYAYTNLVAKHFNAEFESFGLEGSGTWDAYFQLEKYLKDNPAPDVVLFAWSASMRLYHPEVRNICYNSAVLNPAEPESPTFKPLWKAAKAYYEYLYDAPKANMDHSCLYYWIDTVLVPKYPNTKFIHMWSFPNNACNFGKPQDMEYLYEFTTAVEIRPALIHLSYLDEWPNDLSKETRIHHMTPKMHNILADTIIAAIEDYNSGLLNIQL
jgi:hypothetical protein